MSSNEYQEIKNQLSQLQFQVQTLVDKVEQPGIPKSKTDEELDDLIDVAEAARITRYSESTVYTKSSKGEMPCKKKDGRLHFSKKQILEWIDSGRKSISLEDPTSRMIKIHKRYKK